MNNELIVKIEISTFASFDVRDLYEMSIKELLEDDMSAYIDLDCDVEISKFES